MKPLNPPGNAAWIASAKPLSELREQPAVDFVCTVCGRPDEFLDLLIECDEHDRHTARTIYLGSRHETCRKVLQAHPRLYVEGTGKPGSFPKLCGPCIKRGANFSCSDERLIANGGDGLRVDVSHAFGGTIVCGRGHGCRRPLPEAWTCEGQVLRGETEIDSSMEKVR